MLKKSKRIMAIIVGLFMIGMSIVSQAASTRSIRISPQLRFVGQTTECSVVIMGEKQSDEISVVVKLYKNGYCINMWSKNGNGTLLFEEQSTAVKGCSYRMTVSAKINGVTQPTVTVSKVYE